MKVLDRFATLLRADAHGMMENLEERSLVIKQHLRDADLALEGKKRRLASFEDESRGIDTQTSSLDAALAGIDRDVELALAQGEEELARFAIRRLLPKREARERLRARASTLATEREALASEVARQQVEFDELARDAEVELLELARRDRAQCEPRDAFAQGRPAAEQEVELELLRRRTAPMPGADDTRSEEGMA